MFLQLGQVNTVQVLNFFKRWQQVLRFLVLRSQQLLFNRCPEPILGEFVVVNFFHRRNSMQDIDAVGIVKLVSQ